MNDLIVTSKNLPANVEDLSKFVLVGREKLVAVRAEIRAIEKVGLAEEVRQQKLQEAQDISEAVLDAEVRIGELMATVPKAKNQYQSAVDNGVHSTKAEVIEKSGFTVKQVQRFETLAKNKDIVEQAKAEARENDDAGAKQRQARKEHYYTGERKRFYFTDKRFCGYIVYTKSLLAYS